MKRRTKEKIKDYIKILALINTITIIWIIASLLASLIK